MAERRIKRRKVSYLSTTISITLVLFLVGIFGLMVFHANQLKNYFKEQVEVSIEFRDNVNEPDIYRLKSQLEERPYVKKVKYLSKEDARKIMKKQMGEDAGEILGYNPYPASLNVYFQSWYTQPDSLVKFKENWSGESRVRNVIYQKEVIENINRYVSIGGAIVLVLAIIFLIVAIALINSTIRLNLYSKRFLIKSMQLVGATRWFIRKPFVLRSMRSGLVGAIAATVLLSIVLYFTKQQFGMINYANYIGFYALLFLIIVLLGLLITGFSSLFSINKYLKMKLEDLY